VQQLGGQLIAQLAVEYQPPIAGKLDGRNGGHTLRDAGNPDGVIPSEGTALASGDPSSRAVPRQAEAGRLDPGQRSRRTSGDPRFKGGLEPHRQRRQSDA
jgi:hypothetical protein